MSEEDEQDNSITYMSWKDVKDVKKKDVGENATETNKSNTFDYKPRDRASDGAGAARKRSKITDRYMQHLKEQQK